MWQKDTRTPLTIERCLSSTPTDTADLARESHAWLQRHGAINYGAIDVSPPKPPTPEPEPPAEEPTDQTDEPEAPREFTDELLTERTVAYLRTADMNTTTEKQIRKAIEAELGADLTEKKLVVRAIVTGFLEDPDKYKDVGAKEDKDKDDAEKAREVAKAKAAVAKAARAIEAARPKPTKPVVVVGAGPAGLAAARMVTSHGVQCIVLEARDRVGGRVHTDRSSLSVPVDMGASIITGCEPDAKRRTGLPWLGVRADPSATIAAQLGLALKTLGNKLPLYDGVTGELVSDELDARVERHRDALMDRARLRVDREGDAATAKMSLAEVIEDELEQAFGEDGDEAADDEDNKEADNADGDKKEKVTLTAQERRLLGWHWANLEYGCSAPLSKISMAHWNQDEPYGGFGGPHCMVKGGYGQIVDSLAKGLDIRHEVVVKKVRHFKGDADAGGVEVTTASGEVIEGSACIVTAPLGCLKSGDIEFAPRLSEAKSVAIARLGFGHLNKVVMEFEKCFWDESVDYFGAAREHYAPDAASTGDDSIGGRGRMFMFWNLKEACGGNVLVGLVAGSAAEAMERTDEPTSSLVSSAMGVLRRIFESSEGAVTEPKKVAVSRWGADPYSKGSYSYVAVGASAEDYDELGRPEQSSGGRLLFAGEHTCKEHPDTVGGAVLTGWRSARHALHVMNGDAGDPFDEVFKLVSLEDIVGEDDSDDSDDSDADASDSDDEEDVGGARKKGKKKKRKKKYVDGEDGPEDDEKARDRMRRRLEKEKAERMEQLEREQKEMTDGKEEVKRVLRHVASSPDGVAVDTVTFDGMLEMMPTLETASGRGAFCQSAVAKMPPAQLANLALRDGGLALSTLAAWLEQVTAKPSGKELSSKMLKLLLALPTDVVDARVLRESGVARVVADRFNAHPIPDVRLLARRCAHHWSKAASAAKARRDGQAKAKKLKAEDKPLGFIDDDGVSDDDSDSERPYDPDDSRRRVKKAKPPPKPMTVEEIIESAAGLQEGAAAAEAQRLKLEADAALAAARQAADDAKAEMIRAEQVAQEQLRGVWDGAPRIGKKQKLRMKTFEDFAKHKTKKREHKKRQREEREREDEEDARMEAEEAAAAERGEPMDASGGSPTAAGARAGAGAGVGVDLAAAAAEAARIAALGPEERYAEDVKKAVRFYVRKQLKQGIKEKKLRGLNKDSCGKIEEKVAAKVVEGSTSLGVPGDSAEAFLSKQRREKVKKMVESYAASYAKAKK